MQKRSFLYERHTFFIQGQRCDQVSQARLYVWLSELLIIGEVGFLLSGPAEINVGMGVLMVFQSK